MPRIHRTRYDAALAGLLDPIFCERLTYRERECLSLRGCGMSVEAIATGMGITWSTVWDYRSQAAAKWAAYIEEGLSNG